MSARDDALLHDMLLVARRVATYMDGVDRERFDREQILQDAVVRQLTVLGEAAAAVSGERQAALPEIPWHRISGMRHRIVHDYRRIRLDIVWDVATRRLPEIRPILETAVPNAEEGTD